MAKQRSYNPFYIPSLAQMQKEARAEAQSAIDAEIAALPTDQTTRTQFSGTGHFIQGLDQSYINFLNSMKMARAGEKGNIQVDPGQMTDQAQGAVTGAEGAQQMLGIGFENQLGMQRAAGMAGLTEHQLSNNAAMVKALKDLQDQRSAAQAKFGTSYLDILNQKKQNAMAAYQAFLGNQFNNAQLDATVANQQGQLNIDQQNANIRQQNANTAADKNANAANPNDKTRASGRNKTRDFLQTQADKEFHGPATSQDYTSYAVVVKTGVDRNGNPVYKNFPAIQAKAGTPLADVRKQAISVYHLDQLPGIDLNTALSLNRGETTTKTIPGPVTHRQYNWLLRNGVGLMMQYRWTRKTATRLVKAMLAEIGVEAPPNPPSNPPPGSHGPGR